jgi:uncharacterized protein
MKIYLSEITENDLELDYSENDPWVAAAVERVDEHMDDAAIDAAIEVSISERRPRRIETHISLRKVDDVVVLSGEISTTLQLVCSRCASLFEQNCNPTFSALFCKDPVMAGIAHLQITGNDPHKKTGRVVGTNHGFARHAHDSESDESTLQGKDLDITYLSNDYIDLSDVLTEQLQFQTPFQPLCREECKGICSSCGVDLNHGLCLCKKTNPRSPFSALSDLKL